MQRFLFLESPLGKDITIKEPSFVHQISRVLRSEIGDSIILFDGDSNDYAYTINFIDKKEIGLTFMENIKNNSDPLIHIRLYQALPNKYEKIEYILQKGVEVGISEFIFFRSERSQKLIINERKIERFREIIRESTEQCGGNKMAKVTFPEGKFIFPTEGILYVFHTENINSKHIREIPTNTTSLNLFVGPEGGWSEAEMDDFEKKDIQRIHLGKRILRTETTGVVASFFLLNK